MSDLAAQHLRPLWLAALLTSIAMPLVVYLTASFAQVAQGGSWADDGSMRALGFVLMVGVPITALIMFAIGIPFLLWLRASGRLFTHFVWIGAALIGAVGLYGLARFTAWRGHVPYPLLVGAIAGFLAGVIFTLIAGIRFRKSTS